MAVLIVVKRNAELIPLHLNAERGAEGSGAGSRRGSEQGVGPRPGATFLRAVGELLPLVPRTMGGGSISTPFNNKNNRNYNK